MDGTEVQPNNHDFKNVKRLGKCVVLVKSINNSILHENFR